MGHEELALGLKGRDDLLLFLPKCHIQQVLAVQGKDGLMGSRRAKSSFRGLGAVGGRIAISLVLLAVGLILDGMGIRHGDKLVFVGLLMLLASTVWRQPM